MSTNPEKMPEDEEEGKMMQIPVFTVIKNGVILKNIFVVNKPPSPLSQLNSFTSAENPDNPDQETEEILIAGRHPDCNIVLMHPSISRFHFQINSKPSLQKLFVTDLSSVHGTWVSEKKIDPGFHVELKEGDTIRVGASTRLYRLHWVPLGRAYDMENPFVSESDLAMIAEMEEENVEKTSQNEDLVATENKNVEEKDSLVVLGKEEETNQKIDSFDSENGEIQYVDSVLESVVSFPDENSGLIVKKEIPSAPLMSKDINSSVHDGKEEIENSSRSDELSLKSVGGVILQTLSAIFYECNQSPEDHSAKEENTDISMPRVELESHVDVSSDSPASVTEVDSAFKIPTQNTSQNLLRKDKKQIDTLPLQPVHLSMPSGEPSGTNNECIYKENHPREDLVALHPLGEEEKQGNSSETRQLNEPMNLQNASIDDLAVTGKLEEKENQNPLRKEGIQSEFTFVCAVPIQTEEGIQKQGNSSETRQLNEPMNLQNATSDDLAVTGKLEETENQSPLRKEGIQSEFTFVCADPIQTEESVNPSLPLGEVLAQCKESQTPLSGFYAIEHLENLMSPEYHSAKEEYTDISMKRLESHVDVSSYSPSSATKVHSACKFPEREPSEINNKPMNKERQTEEDLAVLFPLHEEGNQDNSTENQQLHDLLNLQNICSDDLAATEMLEEMESQSPSRKEGTLSTIVSAAPLEKETALGEVLSKNKESQTPQSDLPAIGNLENIMSSIRSEKKSNLCNIWSRRGKPATPLQLQTSRSQRKIRSNDGINGDSELENQEHVESESISRALFTDLEAMDEEIFTPDKENCAPNTSILRSLKKGRRLEDIQLSKSGRSSSSKIKFSPSMRLEDKMIGSSDKENQTPKAIRERKSARSSGHHLKLEEDIVLKERRAERVPLQSLISNSPARGMSEASFPSTATSGSISVGCNQKKVTNFSSVNSDAEGRRRWTMIADTTSLLDKETRKALQLLQGIKGTHLIIPRMVIRELDSLKRCGSFFRRTTEASVTLQWIEECMAKTKWWIHVQSSLEEAMPIAPTPPATPVSRFSEGSEVLPYQRRSSASSSAYGSLLEIASPTAEDHILDCALSYRKMKNDRQLVLLSNNVTLKIKAMAEGLICETAKEFRDSLVNPFSGRFLWAESAPRGQTWSVMDDIVLKYYRSPSKKSSKGEGVKGLKLILLHNSHYGQNTSFV